MSALQPGTLSNGELIKYYDMYIAAKVSAPIAYQKELLRRFAAIAPEKEHTPRDLRQLELFK